MYLRRAAISLIIWLTIFVISAAGQSSKIFGVYGQCPFACRYIQINSDHSFEELLTGDLFNGQRKKGTWEFIGKNKIKAESHKPSDALRVRESVENGLSYRITVADWAGAVLPHVEIAGSSGGKSFECVTDDGGSCEIPKTAGFDLRWNQFSSSYTIKDRAANRFEVELTYEQLDHVIDEVWQIEGKRLFVESDRSVDKTGWMEKLNQQRGRKLFPPGK
jgi:hypothetical protein